MKIYKSPINWYGGKFYMANDIIALFPEHKMYVEGFGGAGHVLFKNLQVRWKSIMIYIVDYIYYLKY